MSNQENQSINQSHKGKRESLNPFQSILCSTSKDKEKFNQIDSNNSDVDKVSKIIVKNAPKKEKVISAKPTNVYRINNEQQVKRAPQTPTAVETPVSSKRKKDENNVSVISLLEELQELRSKLAIVEAENKRLNSLNTINLPTGSNRKSICSLEKSSKNSDNCEEALALSSVHLFDSASIPFQYDTDEHHKKQAAPIRYSLGVSRFSLSGMGRSSISGLMGKSFQQRKSYLSAEQRKSMIITDRERERSSLCLRRNDHPAHQSVKQAKNFLEFVVFGVDRCVLRY